MRSSKSDILPQNLGWLTCPIQPALLSGSYVLPFNYVSDLSLTMFTQIEGLRLCIGVEGFFCIVRSNTEFFAHPHFYFSRPEIQFYLALIASSRSPWIPAAVAAKIEAFAIAGCDVAGNYSYFFLFLVYADLFLSTQ